MSRARRPRGHESLDRSASASWQRSLKTLTRPLRHRLRRIALGGDKPPSRRRLDRRLITASLVAVGLLGVGGWGWHAWQVRGLSRDWRAAGLAATAAGQWSAAQPPLLHYLRLSPDDGEALAALAVASQHMMATPADASRVKHYYSLAIAHADDPRDLQLRLARLHLPTTPDEALRLAEGLLAKNPRDAAAHELRAQAIDGLWTARESPSVTAKELIAAYEAWRAAAPADAAPPVRLATIYMTQAERLTRELGQPEAEWTRRARHLGNDLIAAAPREASTYLGRFAIRQLADASTAGDFTRPLDADLARALEIEPAHLEANLAAAAWLCPALTARRTGFPRAAPCPPEERMRAIQQHLITAQHAAPLDERPYLMLAELGMLAGDAAGATRVVQLAAEKLAAPGPAFWLRAAEQAIETAAWGDALARLERAQRTLAISPSEWSAAHRAEIESWRGVIALLQARIPREVASEGHHATAIAGLERLVQHADDEAQKALAYRHLAELYRANGRAGEAEQADRLSRGFDVVAE